MKLIAAIKLAFRLWRYGNGQLIGHAKREFSSVWPEQDDMQDLMKQNIIELLQVFSAQGHSGFSAGYCISAFEKLAMFKPIGPLTGEAHEWSEPYCHEGTCQNRRDGRVFKEADGTAYFIDGKIFREPDGACFTSRESRVYITEWPYTPVSIYVDR